MEDGPLCLAGPHSQELSKRPWALQPEPTSRGLGTGQTRLLGLVCDAGQVAGSGGLSPM